MRYKANDQVVNEFIEKFKALPYYDAASVYREMTIVFEQWMTEELKAQLKDKADAVVIECVNDLRKLYKLTNVHGNVYLAEYDLGGKNKYDVDGYFFWKDDAERLKLYLKGDLRIVVERICNL